MYDSTAILGGTKHRLDLEVSTAAVAGRLQLTLEIRLCCQNMSSRGYSTSISIGEYMFVSGLAAPACSQGASFLQELHEIIDRLNSLLARNGMTVENSGYLETGHLHTPVLTSTNLLQSRRS